MMFMNLSNTAISNTKRFHYACIFRLISKNKAINLMRNGDLTKKSKILVKHKSFLSHIKMVKQILIFGNIEIEKNKF